MEDGFRTFDANASSSGKSLILTIPKATCEILSLKEGDFLQVMVRVVKTKNKR